MGFFFESLFLGVWEFFCSAVGLSQEVTFQNAIVMIERFHLSIDAIVKELNIKKEELLEYIKLKKEEK